MNKDAILGARGAGVPLVEHGGPDHEELRRLGLDPDEVLDFSVCTNPFGPSPRVYEAIARVAVDRYPDREAHALRTALAEAHALSPQDIVVGNGVSELIWLAALAFVRPRDRVLVIGPTYGEYARSARLQGGAVIACDAREQDYFEPAAREIETQLDGCRLVFLCNPNNPTGHVICPEVIVSWTRRHPGTLFVVDEAYQKFASGSTSLLPSRQDNLLILRSMTKDYALAGLRIGYAVGSARVVGAVARVRPPWSVNAMAEAAAVAALGDADHLVHTLGCLARAKQDLARGLTELGLPVWPSAAHFFLVRVGDAAAFRAAILSRGVLVRDAASFGLPAFVRLATRRPEDNARLLVVLGDMGWKSTVVNNAFRA